MNWISVEDELPIEDEQVLVYIPWQRGIHEVCYYELDHPRKFSCYDHYQCLVEEDVTHWMRLTKPE